MPNWCANKLTVIGPNLDVELFRKMMIGHSPWPSQREGEGNKENLLNFHSIVPIPAEVLIAGYDPCGVNWERQNWGCARGAVETAVVDEWEGVVTYHLATAWFPPIQFLVKAAKRFPTLTLLLEYDERDGGFKGIARFNGQSNEDHRVSY
jgi:hypothetical protein